jgi:predicted Zn-ribbon and HTH transcriptional regulator
MNVVISGIEEEATTNTIKIPNKRGPKKLSEKLKKNAIKIDSDENHLITHEEKIDENIDNDDNCVNNNKKKRGRKPKGGKIVSLQSKILTNETIQPKNIILHLKCSLKEIMEDNTNSQSNISYYNLSRKALDFESVATRTDGCYNNNKNNETIYTDINFNEKFCIKKENELIEDDIEYSHHNDTIVEKTNNNYNYVDENNKKEIYKKLKKLENILHTNTTLDKKSACFWCTYDFNNPSIHIPKFCVNEVYNVYGCFCSPECATAYLMKENIDNSTKFERYQLLNHIYCQVYKYNKNIKPAPNPYYLLDKYFGNLNIQEYRSLLQNERIFLVVDKPLSLVMSELFDCNDEFVLNKKIIPINNSNSSSSSLSIKKNIKKNNTTHHHNTIFDENFS